MPATAVRELAIHGECRVWIFDGSVVHNVQEAIAARDAGLFASSTGSPNLVVTSGLNDLCRALAWALITNQNAGFGNPFLSSWGNLGNLYGAIGSSTATVAAANTSLGTETTRALVGLASVAGGVMTYDAYLPVPAAATTITEVAWFENATSASNNGTMLDRSVLSVSVAQSTAEAGLVELALTVKSG